MAILTLSNAFTHSRSNYLDSRQRNRWMKRLLTDRGGISTISSAWQLWSVNLLSSWLDFQTIWNTQIQSYSSGTLTAFCLILSVVLVHTPWIHKFPTEQIPRCTPPPYCLQWRQIDLATCPAVSLKLIALFNILCTVVWNDYVLIFSQKCHILFHKKVGNSLQIIKYINLSRFQHILKLKVNFVESSFI